MDKDKIAEYRKTMSSDLKNQFSDLEHQLAKFNPIQILSLVSSIVLTSQQSSLLKTENSVERFPDDESVIEYLLSFILSLDYPDESIELPRDDQQTIKDIYGTIERIFHLTKDYFFTEFTESKLTPSEIAIRFRIIMKSINLRGHYYFSHFKSFISEFVNLIASYKNNEFGGLTFSIMNLWEFLLSSSTKVMQNFLVEMEIIKLMKEMEEKYNQFHASLAEGKLQLDPRIFDDMKKSDKKDTNEEDQVEKIREIIFEEFKNKNLELHNKILQKQKQLGGSPEPFQKYLVFQTSPADQAILDELSLTLGENKTTFAFPKYAYNILNPSLIYVKPFVNHDGKFFNFHHLLPVRSVLTVTENLIKTYNKSYRNNFLIQRDKFTEYKTKELFQQMLESDDDHTFNSLYYGEFELDILIIQDRALLLIEVKAGRLPESANRGSVKSYISGMDELIGKAFEQAERALRYIKENPIARFYEEDRSTLITEVSHEDFDFIIPISVFLENIGDSITNLGLMNQLNLVSGYDFWAVNIFDLYVFKDIIKYPSQLIHYLNRRFSFEGREKLSHIDELEFLGLYLQNNGYLPEEISSTQIEEMTSIVLDGFMEEIDDYFYTIDSNFFYNQSKILPDLPCQEMPPFFERLISKLNSEKPKNFILVSSFLLDLAQEEREKINEFIEGWELDENDHGFTIGFGNKLISFYRSEVETISTLFSKFKGRLEEYDREELIIILWDKALETPKCRINLGLMKK